MDDAQAVGFGEAIADLFADTQDATAQLPDIRITVLRSSPATYSMVMKWAPSASSEIEHPADVPVPDLPGELELVREPLDRLVRRRSRA